MTGPDVTNATALYRYFDEAGSLLYVGISKNPITRLGQHKRDKDWWAEIRNITIESHATREAAEVAERHAIETEFPRWNIVHNSGDSARWIPGETDLVVQAIGFDQRVAVLLAVSRVLRARYYGDPSFCANRVWYGGMREILCRLVGWSATHWPRGHWMGSSEAYSAVYEAAYWLLPDCQPDCMCPGGRGRPQTLMNAIHNCPNGHELFAILTQIDAERTPFGVEAAFVAALPEADD